MIPFVGVFSDHRRLNLYLHVRLGWCARRTQEFILIRAERPVGVFGPPTSKFIFTRLARMVCSEDTRVYTGSGGPSLRPVCCRSCYQHLVCSRGYKQAREGEDPKSLVEGVNEC